MSSNMTPTSFASAAAGQSRGSRPGDGNGDWSRREGRAANGTMTFRRPSAAPSNQTSQPATDASSAIMSSVAESRLPAQQDMPSFDGSLRYSRDQLLSIFKVTAAESSDVSSLFVGGWNPSHANGSTRGWGKSSEGTVPQDPTVCWDANGLVKPIGLQELTAEEKEIFADVNSALKPQQQKDSGQGGGINGRKSSVSHGSGYNVPSPLSASRPATRRRETSDTNPFPSSAGLTSPLATRTPREESSWFGRKSNEQKEHQQFDEPEEDAGLATAKSSGLGTLGRNITAGPSSSLWGSSGTASSSGMGAFGNFALPSSIGDKRFGSARGESRLAHLIPKQDTEAVGSIKPTVNNSGANSKDSWRPRQRTDTDPFSEDSGIGGNAAPGRIQHPFDTPSKNTSGDFGMSGLNIGSSADDDTVGSPETNPFRSPPADHGDEGHHYAAAASGGLDRGQGGIGGAGVDHASNFGSIRGYPGNAYDGSDRSQTSSVGAKGFTGLGNIAGWGNALNTSTPDRERAVFSSAFGSSLFSPVTGELQSPGFTTGVPGVFGPQSSVNSIGATGSLRGTIMLGPLFTPSIQAQMSGNQEQESSLSDSIPDLRQTNPLGAIGRETIGSQVRQSDVGARSSRGLFDELMEANRAGASAFTSNEPQTQPGILPSAPSPISQTQPFDSARSSTDTPPNLPRTMVMPDRMRWVYLDPQGQTQGPFTGLEMNDWYKATFFTPDLRVKKVEDTEFEPLGQLIRRIGNSREPFLVPQMGIAHGQPSLSGTFAHGDRGTVIPPLVGAFPSYGRTLTAEEQNNLERRKQEEQYMLARQREMMAVQHHPFPAGRIPPTGVSTGALHHHSSAHSLQSQPSFGSMTSPLGAAPPPIPPTLGATPGFFDHAGMPPPTTQPPISSSSEFLRDELNLQERQMLSGLQTAGGIYGPPQMSTLPIDTATHGILPNVDELSKDDQGFSERLKEFKQLREQMDAESVLPGATGMSITANASQITGRHGLSHQVAAAEIMDEVERHRQQRDGSKMTGDDASLSPTASLSLTQQAQKAQASTTNRHVAQTEAHTEPLAASHVDLPPLFPSALGQPMPSSAPTAQRTPSALSDQYAASRPQSETQENATASSSTAQPPALAPWAREPGADSHKGPSLKEIQEAEAKKAAKAEEVASAARKAAAEQEAALLRDREKANATVAPGLPTSSTWANGAASSSVTAPGSPWSKPGLVKANTSVSTSSSSAHSAAEKKKTLAEIQREEEVRKQRSKELSQSSPVGNHGAGKRYADLASKVQASPVPGQASVANPFSTGSGWATVGAGGKVKAPAGPSASRSTTSTVSAMKPTAVPQAMARSASKPIPSPVNKLDAGGAAMEEFNKWLHRELSRGISGGIDLDGFVDSLLQLPLDQTIISEAVYANSTTMDGRHFADEFIRRKRLAEKGVVEKQATTSSTGDNKTSGGWSEVAKKGGNQKEDTVPAGFKVVPNRKKGKK